MLNEYGPNGTINPNTFTVLYAHTHGDGHWTNWGDWRHNPFYYDPVGNCGCQYPPCTGTPDTWFGGRCPTRCYGAYTNNTQMYNWYMQQYNAVRANPTDITIDAGGAPVTGQTYRISAEVCRESGSTPKAMRIYMVDVLDNWPTSPTDQRNCVQQGPASPYYVQQISLMGGECQLVEHDFTFDTDSWSNQSDIKIVIFAQEPNSSWNAEIYQAAVITWPFPPVGPPRGDMDGSMVVDENDVPYFVLALVDPAAYLVLFPDMDPNVTGDVNQDGSFNGDDIFPFINLLLDLDPPTPNPMYFSFQPQPQGMSPTTKIFMAGALADDPDSPPVYYQFDEAGGMQTPWQSDNFYTDVGLTPNTMYSYRVRARDSAPSQNTTQWSDASSAATEIEAPAGLAAGTITSTSIEVTATGGPFTNLNLGDSGLLFEWREGTTFIGTSGWIQTTTVTANGLTLNTSYTFRVRGRNQELVTTDWVQDVFTTDP